MDNKYLFTDNIDDVYINNSWGLKSMGDITVYSGEVGSGKTRDLLRFAINKSLVEDKKVLILDFEGSYLGYYRKMIDRINIAPGNIKKMERLKHLEYNMIIKRVESEKEFRELIKYKSMDYLIVDNLNVAVNSIFKLYEDIGRDKLLRDIFDLISNYSDNFDGIIIENTKNRGI